jgi:uncharacterized membrane protein YfcA
MTFLDPWVGGLDAWVLGLLAATAFATSVLSAIVGMAGGITLLAVMLLFFDPLVAVPLHGIVQLVSNSSRTVAQRSHVRWDIVWRYALPLLPLGWLGLLLAESISPDVARLIIGVFVLVATWRPAWILVGTHPENSDPHRRFFGLGAVVGVVNITVGATGPLIAPFFLNLGWTRFALIGTKAACQAAGHLAKIVVFGIAGFAFGNWLGLLAILSLCVVGGTAFGTRLLGGVSERAFIVLYRAVLTLIAVFLVVRNVSAVWPGG